MLSARGRARPHWFKLYRTPQYPEYAWQSQPPLHRLAKHTRDQLYFGGYYAWRGVRFVPSWGGSMFEALMPGLVLDERRYAPASLGRNDRMHAVIQRRYALEKLGYPVWGLSPSASPATGAYGEYGVKPLGTRGYTAGAVTPHAAALALSVPRQRSPICASWRSAIRSTATLASMIASTRSAARWPITISIWGKRCCLWRWSTT